MIKVNELFAPPIGLEPAIKIGGTTFYSSDKLKDNFNIAFSKSSRGRGVAPEISKLVKKGIIIPCYKSKGLLSFITKKFFKNPNDAIIAFYDLDEKKVIVTIDNEITVFGTASNNNLASTTMHECMHLAASKNLAGFIRAFFQNLMMYYTAFFTDYFKLQGNIDKNISNLIRYVAVYERKGPRYANKDLKNYYDFLNTEFGNKTQLSEQDFVESLTNLIIACKLLIVSFGSFQTNIRRFAMLITSLNTAYFKAFGAKNKYSMPIQELISLSEVACILAEMKPDDKSIKQIFKLIS